MRGISSQQELKGSQLIRDTRPLTQKIADVFSNPKKVALVYLVIAAGAYFLAPISDFLIMFMIVIFIYSLFKHETLPFRMPMSSGEYDYNDLKPGTRKPKKAEGIYFFGNEKQTKKELWFSNDDMRTHCLIFGSTGSGKTVSMISVAMNALIQGSGFIYVDGKGDNSLYASLFSMVRYMGREDDLLLINFMTGARDIIGPQEYKLSNTLNPFATGSSGMLSNLVTGMMDSGSSSGDGDMWKGRAIAFVEALMKVLVAMRDAGYILLDANTIRNYFSLDRLEAMASDKTFIRDGQYAISMDNMPDVILEPIKNYLSTLPGYQPERKGKQVSQVFEQHGYITMQLTRVFTSLSDTYGHIMRTKLAEVDLKDVVLNRRILNVLLPALEKSPDELANLGKVIIASLKSMMASGLGDQVEGDYHDLVLKKPTNAPTPYLCILDEYGYYAVKGFAVVPAQARSLGFSVIFAGQDLPAFQKASKEEAASIGANTNIKICMKLEDPQETWEFFMKSAGESYVTAVDSFATNSSSISDSYQDTKSAKTEKRARIDLLDLKDQGLGEATILFKSTIVRANLFFANPKPCKEMQLNQFLKVDLPKDQEMYTLVKGIEDFEEFCQRSVPQISVEKDAHLDQIFELFDNSSSKLLDNALSGFVAICDKNKLEATNQENLLPGDEHASDTEDVKTTSLNIFSMPSAESSLLSQLVDQLPKMDYPLVNRSQLDQIVIYILRCFGCTQKDAQRQSAGVIQSLTMSTTYLQPKNDEVLPVPKCVETINTVIDSISKAEQKDG